MCLFRQWLLLMGIVAGCVVFLAQCPCRALATDWKDRLLSEAPPKWAALEQYYAKMEASLREVNTETPKFPGEFPDHASIEIRKNGDWIVYTSHTVGKSSDGKRMDNHTVRGVNSRYAFLLGKTSPEAESYLLSKFEPATDEYRRGHEESTFSIVYKVNSWECVPLSVFIKSPFVTITDVRGVQRGSRELAQLSYEHRLEMAGRPVGVEHGTVVLDPEHCWCVRECHSELPDSIPAQKIDGFLEYGDEVDGFPILRRQQNTVTYRDGKGKMATTCEFDKLVHRDIPESEFTLSAFGLPEVQVPGEQKPRTLWRWLLGIGIALGVLAVLFRAYARRRGGMPQST